MKVGEQQTFTQFRLPIVINLGIFAHCLNSAHFSVYSTQEIYQHTQVILYQLNVGATPISREKLLFGALFGPIFLDYLACTGTEEAIVNCSHITAPLDCDQSMNDVGIKCFG